MANNGKQLAISKERERVKTVDGCGYSFKKRFESQVSAKLPIRVWHLVSLTILSLILLIIAICCIKDCRIPRTRQEIERKRRLNSHRASFIEHLKQLQNLDLPFEQILELIKEQEKRSRRKSSHFSAKRLTILQRIRLLVTRKSSKKQNFADGLVYSIMEDDKLNECLESQNCLENEDEIKGLLKQNKENLNRKNKIDSLTIEISEC